MLRSPGDYQLMDLIKKLKVYETSLLEIILHSPFSQGSPPIPSTVVAKELAFNKYLLNCIVDLMTSQLPCPLVNS